MFLRYRLLTLAILPALASGLTQTSVTLSVNANPSTYGQPVLLTASIAVGATGKVTFYDGADILGVAAISNSHATLTVATLPSGARTLQAYYSGDATYAPSRSAYLAHIVIANASLGFHRPVFSSAISRAANLAVGDFNGDGRLDLVESDGESSAVQIFLGDGAGGFQTGGTINTASTTGFVTVGDFDGDGKADIVVAGRDTSDLSILKGNGDATFQPAQRLSLDGSPSALAVGDFNRDGIADLAVLSASQGRLSILLGKGDGTFQSAFTSAIGNRPTSLAVADFNHDGNADIVAAASGFVIVLLGRGDGSFLAAVNYPTGWPNRGVVVRDMNDDGEPDLIVSGAYGLSILLGAGDGVFAAATHPAYGNFQSAAVADFDGDGKTDIAALDIASNAVVLLSGNGDGSLQPARNYPAESSSSLLAAEDFNADGRADLLVAGSGIRVLLGGATPEIVLGVNHGSGFAPDQGRATYNVTVRNAGDLDAAGPATVSVTVPAGFLAVALDGAGWSCMLSSLTCSRQDTLTAGASYSPIAATVKIASTFNGDATAYFELAGTGMRAADTLSVQHAVTNLATFLRPKTAVAPSNGFLPSTSYSLDITPGYTGIGDFNSDGIPDIVAIGGGKTVLLAGVGDGTFRAPVDSPAASSNATSGVTADFNHDGKLDIAVTDGPLGLVIMLGNGDGTFTSHVAWSSNTFPDSLAAADFNRDGILDLVAVSSGAILVFLGNGDGTFRAPSTAAASGYQLVQTGDMNGDGWPDLIGLTNGQNTFITVFINNTHVGFQAIPAVPDNRDPMEFAVGDFNGDGKLDVALAEGAQVKFLPGLGNGSFGNYTLSNLYIPLVTSTVVGDFNGDGKLDFAFVGTGLTLVIGNGDGTFPFFTSFQPGTQPVGLAAGDLNGDGRTDFVVNYFIGQRIDVYLGASFSSLSVASTHTAPFAIGQTGTYQITIGNPEFTPVSGVVTVIDTLPAGLTATAIAGSGWICLLSSLTCTRFDALATGDTYPPISLTVRVSDSLSPTSLTNQATVSYAGTVGLASDPTAIVLPTTTVLTVTPNPAVLGQLVTITATETTGSTGTVSFSDGANILGLATLVNGQATFATRLLPAGVNPLTATYSGDATHALSRSATQSELVKAGAAAGFNAKTNFTTGITPMAIASGDFNQDGIADLVTANTTANTVSVLLGNGDGTFQRHVDYAAGTTPSSLVVGDFNNDGKMDIAVASQSTPYVNFLLGNGNGTFQPVLAYNAGTWPAPLAVGDFKGEGKTYLLIGANSPQYLPIVQVSVNSDGSFHTEQLGLGSDDSIIAIGDFNNDNKADLVQVSVDLYVSTGNGDGTFQAPNGVYTTGANALAMCDLNGDGKTDIVTADSVGVDVLLGNGDGTFQNPLRQSTGNQSPALVCADADGDGHLDVLSVNIAGNLTNVMLGNGDGTLQPPLSYPVGASPRGLVVGDFNGDGASDLAVANSQGSSVSVLLGIAYPVLGIASSHQDPFGQGEVGATYTIVVTNTGPNSTAGVVTVSDTLPSGLTATAIAGTGWTCTLSNLTCTRSDALSAGASYPAVTVTLNVGSNAPALVTNSVSVSGGSAVPATAADPTNVSSGPPTTVLTNPSGLPFNTDGVAHVSPWTGYLGAGSHTIGVTTTQMGTPGTQYIFTGWSDSGAATHVIAVGSAGATYTATFKTQYLLTVNVNPIPGGSVSPASGTYFDSGSSVTLTATANSPYVFTSWSGDAIGVGGTTSTILNGPALVTATFNVPGFTCSITGDAVPGIADAQLIVNEALGAIPPNDDLNRDLVVNVADVQKVLNAVLGLGCIY